MILLLSKNKHEKEIKLFMKIIIFHKIRTISSYFYHQNNFESTFNLFYNTVKNEKFESNVIQFS